MRLNELKALEQIYGSQTTVEAVNKVASLRGIPIVLCARCLEPELKSEAWASDAGWLCRCCGRAERIMNETVRREVR